jgi:hypothetical protein
VARGTPLLLIAEDVEGEAWPPVVNSFADRSGARPRPRLRRPAEEMLEDIAILTKAAW